ncbi:hypothetical protein HJ590_05570 [Naumannella sp. ID2617S]|nr:hypothetical protein [Naumannella sp. ID2617S]
MLRVTEPRYATSEKRWSERRAVMLDGSGRELWRTDKPVTVHDGRVYAVTPNSSRSSTVAAGARLLDSDTGRPVWGKAVAGSPVARIGDHVLLHGHPGMNVVRISDGTIRRTHQTGSNGTVVVVGDSYLLTSRQGRGSTAVQAFASGDDRPLWAQLYPIEDARPVASGDRLALFDGSGTVLPLAPAG